MSKEFDTADALLVLQSPTTIDSGGSLTIFDVEKLYSRKGGQECELTFVKAPDNETVNLALSDFTLSAAEVKNGWESSTTFSIAKEVERLPKVYANIKVKPWDGVIYTGQSDNDTVRVQAHLMFRPNSLDSFLEDVPFTVTNKTSCRQSVSLAKGFLSKETGQTIARTGCFLLRAPGREDVLMTRLGQSETDTHVLHSGGTHPDDGTTLMFLSPGVRTSGQVGGETYQGVLQWSRPADGDSTVSPFIFEGTDQNDWPRSEEDPSSPTWSLFNFPDS